MSNSVLRNAHVHLLEMAAKLASVGHWYFHVPSGRITWSAETYRIHGIDPSETEPDYHTLLQLYDAPSAEKLSALVSRSLDTGEGYEFEGTINRTDGSIRVVAAKAQCLLDSKAKVEVLFGVFQDVTERTRRERFIRTLTNNIPAMVAYWDADLRCQYANLQYYEWFGRTPEEMTGLTIDRLMGPDLFSRNEAFIRGAMKGEPQTFERELVKPSGEVGHTLARYIPDVDSDGRVLGMVVLVTDVTALKAAELQLKKANAAAEEALVTAQSALAVKRDFLSNISHELRNPLTGIVGFGDLLAREGNLSVRAEEQLSHIRTASEILLRTINDLLDVARLEAGQPLVELKSADAVAIAREALLFFSPQIVEKGLASSFSADAIAGLVVIDPVRVRQILFNFISNAVKFTSVGSIIVEVRYVAVRQSLRFDVRDTGCGIPLEHQHRLFQRFSQVDASASRKLGGMGLGLAICKGLADTMSGRVGVDSNVGEGSCFWLEMPAPFAAATEIGSAENSPPEPVPALDQLDVLVVDDHPANRMLIRQLLEPFTARVTEAGSAAECLSEAMARQFDVILLDIMMPEVGGFATAQMIRAQGPNRETPLVAFTASADREILAEGSGLFDDVLTKPISLNSLLELVIRYAPQKSPPSVSA